VLALFTFQVLPVKYAGLALILLGVLMLVGEVLAAGTGVLGLGGIAAFVIGSVILIDTDAPGFGVSRALIEQVAGGDLRAVTLGVPTQDVISRDNVSVKVNAVIYFRIVDPARSIIQVASPFEATSQLAQTTLRSVLGQHELDEMLSQRERLNADIQSILDQQTEAWGIKVSNVELKHVDLDESMVRAMAKQAEAERTRRTKIIHAEGEKQAAAQLVEPLERRRGLRRVVEAQPPRLRRARNSATRSTTAIAPASGTRWNSPRRAARQSGPTRPRASVT
jgi:regulator of protease activity HflC (stomatin/prohibitin superfamily)